MSRRHGLHGRRLAPGTDDGRVEWVATRRSGAICPSMVGLAFTDDVPYVIALVTGVEGARILANIVTDDGEIRTGCLIHPLIPCRSDIFAPRH